MVEGCRCARQGGAPAGARWWRTMSALLEADREAIAAFVDALFRYADDGGYVTMRAFRDDRDGTWRADRWPVRKLNGAGLSSIIDAAISFAGECANAAEPVVFAPPVVTL